MAKNHPMNMGKGPNHPKKAPIQGSSANYMGRSKSTNKTPSPANRPFPPTKRPPMQRGGAGSASKGK